MRSKKIPKGKARIKENLKYLKINIEGLKSVERREIQEE